MNRSKGFIRTVDLNQSTTVSNCGLIDVVQDDRRITGVSRNISRDEVRVFAINQATPVAWLRVAGYAIAVTAQTVVTCRRQINIQARCSQNLHRTAAVIYTLCGRTGIDNGFLQFDHSTSIDLHKYIFGYFELVAVFQGIQTGIETDHIGTIVVRGCHIVVCTTIRQNAHNISSDCRTKSVRNQTEWTTDRTVGR